MATPATMERRQGVLTGNLIYITFGGQTIGLVQSLQAQEDFGLQPASGIGDVMPVEHVAGMGRITLSCDTIFVRPIGKAATLSNGSTVNIGPDGIPTNLTNRDNNLDSLGVAPERPEFILEGRIFDIVVADLARNPVRIYTGCSYASGSISFQKHAMIVRNATFMALSYQPDVKKPS